MMAQLPSVAAQDVYSKLEEPDGLGGLLSLHQGDLDVHDKITAAESAGRWPEALTLYEQVGPLKASCS